ncbi:transketolase [Candidatus Micrarchaeota archaeon CG10_big_fil_rev_8_21_14_0_10_45_29]|nr:MAG: transketolase [Candidatus Micrarchaeota archaeon CG10_big_fil_rev_8_21_14_0_10_45_29]
MNLETDIFSLQIKKAPTRDGWGKALLDLGKKNKNIVALTADLSGSVRTNWFEKEFPQRFFNCGVAEQNMASVASGLALEGKIVFFSSFAVFSPGRNWDQIRVGIAYNNLNVKFSGAHAGITTGPDGATHQALEDIAIMRVLPNVCVLVPCDERESYKCAQAAAARAGPVYIRLGREKLPVFTGESTPFEIGKINVLKEGADVCIVACGVEVFEALKAAKDLAEEGIDAAVLNCHTISPIDKKTIVEYASKCGCMVTAEEHQVDGGMGSAVCEVLAEKKPVPVVRVGMRGFGESAKNGMELIKHFGLDAKGIAKACKEAIAKK